MTIAGPLPESSAGRLARPDASAATTIPAASDADPKGRGGDTRSTMSPFLLLRYTLIVGTAYLLLVEGRFGYPPIGTSLVIAIALASNVVLGLLPRRMTASKAATAAIVLADTVWVTLALLTSGHFSADFFFLYFFILLLAAMGESLALVALGAAVVCIAYLYVLSATGSTWSLWNSPSIIRLPFLFTAAAFYGHMIERLRHEERRAATAQTLAQTRTELLTTVSHEIRNPVNGILGWSDLLAETDLTADQREYVAGIRRAGDSLAAIVNDVLDVAKADAGKLVFEQVPFSVAAAIEDGAMLIAGAAQRKGLELVYRLDPALPAVLIGDPHRLRQVLNNLLSNALKFTSEGEIVVRAHVASRDAASRDAASVLLHVEVADTGVGLSVAQQKRIFNAFEQADGATARRYGGSGLGLAIAKRLVDAMNGTIGVTSRVGAGSTFWFTARLRVPPAEPASTQEGGAGDATGAPQRADAPLAGTRVLVVDDSATVRTVLDEELRALRLRSTVVADGAAALERLRAAIADAAPYAVAFVDADMPGDGGHELVRAIQTAPELRALPIVLLVPLAAGTADGLSVAARLHKPVGRTHLRDCLLHIVEGRPLAFGSPPQATSEPVTAPSRWHQSPDSGHG
jgi:signal transduction histidine kinase/CheY-like chemotaxis protein